MSALTAQYWQPLRRYRRGVTLWRRVRVVGGGYVVAQDLPRPHESPIRRAADALRAYVADRRIAQLRPRTWRRAVYYDPPSRCYCSLADRGFVAPTLRALRRARAEWRRFAQALRLRLQQEQACGRAAHWPDGTLAGWRYWLVSGDGVLSSPCYETVWPSPRAVLRAKEWSASGTVDSQPGIHACWPAEGGALPRALAHLLWADLYVVDCAVGLVAGWGGVVTGEVGWRAQYAAAQVVYVPRLLLPAVRARYPQVPVEPLTPAVVAPVASREQEVDRWVPSR